MEPNFQQIVGDIFGFLLNLLLLPLQFVFFLLDSLFLSKIPGIGVIPSFFRSVISYIGTIPETLANLSGISPLLWNALFITFILYFTITPGIQFAKKIWEWIRP